jgi:hypothetical protein
MTTYEDLASKSREFGPLLQRRFWRPLRSAMQIFHVLPLAAAAVVFVFLATDAQFREIYISYLETPDAGHVKLWLFGLAAAAIAMALVGAVLSEAHIALSTMRINVIYSSYSNPEANSLLRRTQSAAAFFLAFVPWLGVTVGLFGARNFVADRYCKLLGEMDPALLHEKQHVMVPGGWPIVAAVLLLGAAVAAFSCAEQKARVAQRAIALLTPAIALVLFLMFTDWLTLSVPRLWWYLGLTILATALYFAVYRSLYRRQRWPIFYRSRIDVGDKSEIAPAIDPGKHRLEYFVARTFWFIAARPEFSTGFGASARRRLQLMAWAFAPWLLFALYFAITPHVTASTQISDQWDQFQDRSLCPIAATHIPTPGHWTIFPLVMCCTLALGLFSGLLLSGLAEHQKARRRAIIGIVLAFAAAAVFASHRFDADQIVAVYRAIGPLGTAVFQLVFLISTFALLAWLSQRSGFPVLTLVILAIVLSVMFPSYAGLVAVALGVVCVLLAVIAFMSGLREVGAFALILPLLGVIQWHQLSQLKARTTTSNEPSQSELDLKAVKVQYECWLRQRAIPVQDPVIDRLKAEACPLGAPWPQNPLARRTSAAQKYPVFIVAAEGGGIYAASAASIFLGRMQQDASHFSEHVFAVSGVSGGAIGSTVFQALDSVAAAPLGSAGQKTLTDKAREIMEDDHFSPVVGSIFPEILGAPTGRAETLVASFERSTQERDSDAGRALAAPFSRHWTLKSAVPALVLNATWVETGFRVAFAPFLLNATDESLYSFADKGMPDEEADCQKAEKDRRVCTSLMAAAAVSARFPLVLPPFSTAMNGDRRWNFVDGGYTDNSGATTALDLYRTLKDVAADQVDLQIVLITSAIPQPDFTRIKGTVFRDTMAPIDALMKVREDLGNDAVARACSETRDDKDQTIDTETGVEGVNLPEANQHCIARGRFPAAHLHIVEIQDQTYGLALGWKISQTSFEVVSWMLGTPTGCDTDAGAPSKGGASSSGPATTGGSLDVSDNPATDGETATQTVEPRPAKLIGPLEEDKNAKLNRGIVWRNSCIMHAIQGLVEGGITLRQNPASASGKNQ